MYIQWNTRNHLWLCRGHATVQAVSCKPPTCFEIPVCYLFHYNNNIFNCKWAVTQWQWLLCMYINMKYGSTKFKSGGLHEKHAVATWSLILNSTGLLWSAVTAHHKVVIISICIIVNEHTHWSEFYKMVFWFWCSSRTTMVNCKYLYHAATTHSSVVTNSVQNFAPAKI